MKSYTKIYMDYFDYKVAEEVFCECCGRPAVDIHHIYGRGKDKDVISNLQALCRKHHTMAHESKIAKSDLQYIHNTVLSGHVKTFVK